MIIKVKLDELVGKFLKTKFPYAFKLFHILIPHSFEKPFNSDNEALV